jgi:hypothetical protein
MGAFVELVLIAAAFTLVPVLAGHATARMTGRLGHAIALGAIAALSFGAGLWAYEGRLAGVPQSQALSGGLTAGITLAFLPLLVFFELGYWLRSRIALGVVWAVLAAPSMVYGVLLLWSVERTVQCAPAETECGGLG